MRAKNGDIPIEQVRRGRISGVVDSGATRLVLPASFVIAHGFPETGELEVRFADGRRVNRNSVGDVEVEIQGRSGVFTAVVEPGREDALIGAIVLEELDFLPDRTRGVLLPRDPNRVIAEIE
jgi:predicted aspartyl protease